MLYSSLKTFPIAHVADVKEELLKEEDAHEKSMEYLHRKLSSFQVDLANDQKKHSTEISHQDILIEDASKRRVSNLKELLQLRVKWQHHEREQEALLQERERLKQMEQLEQRRKEAIELIQNRLGLLYKSKFKKKPKASKASKKKKKS